MEITTIKIKTLNWKIYVDDPHNSKEESFNEEDCGDTVFMKKKIYLNSNMDDDLMYETIKHELVHAFLFSYGMGQIKFDEEVVCDFVATHCEELIEDSKLILELIKNKRKETKKNGKKL